MLRARLSHSGGASRKMCVMLAAAELRRMAEEDAAASRDSDALWSAAVRGIGRSTMTSMFTLARMVRRWQLSSLMYELGYFRR